MYQYLIFLIFAISACSTQRKSIITQPYYFLGVDNEMPVIQQKGDSLYSMKCYLSFQCDFLENNREVIKKLDILKEKNGVYLIYVTSDTVMRLNRRWVPDGYWVLKIIDQNKIRQYSLFPGLIKDKVIAERIFKDATQHPEKPGYTFYSRSYLEQFRMNPDLATIEDADKIIDLMKSEAYQRIAAGFEKGNGDMYGAGLAAELITRACIQYKYNPMGAALKLDSISRANSDYYSKKYGL
jgi:hypothetical protein